MAPRIVLAALSIAFGIAVVGAAVTTVRQLNLQTWHSADGQSRAFNKDKSSELRT
jgi:hypothetical protein